MERGDGYTIAHRDELERTGDWALVRRSLDCQAFGVNLVEIPLGGSIPETMRQVATKKSCSS